MDLDLVFLCDDVQEFKLALVRVAVPASETPDVLRLSSIPRREAFLSFSFASVSCTPLLFPC